MSNENKKQLFSIESVLCKSLLILSTVIFVTFDFKGKCILNLAVVVTKLVTVVKKQPRNTGVSSA